MKEGNPLLGPSPISARLLDTPSPVIHLIRESLNRRLAAGLEVIDFLQATVRLPLSPGVAQTLREFEPEDLSLHALMPDPGIPALRESVAAYRTEAFHQSIGADNVLITAGANHAFLLAMTALLDPGESAMLLSPYFFNHWMSVHLVGGRPIECALDEAEGFRLDVDRIAEMWAPATRALVVTNPNNPTGTCLDGDAWQSLNDVVRRRAGTLVVDETYFHFHYRQTGARLASPFDISRTVLIGSLSKSFSLAGWRIGYLIARAEVVKELIKAQDAYIISASTAAQRLAMAALADRERHLGAILPELAERHRLLERGLFCLGAFERVYGDAAVFLFAKLACRKDCSQVALDVLEATGVATVPGAPFGQAARGFLRFAYGNTSREEIVRTCELLQNYTGW